MEQHLAIIVLGALLVCLPEVTGSTASVIGEPACVAASGPALSAVVSLVQRKALALPHKSKAKPSANGTTQNSLSLKQRASHSHIHERAHLTHVHSLPEQFILDNEDYRADVVTFLDSHPAGVPDNLSRVSLATAEELYESLLSSNSADMLLARRQMAENIFHGLPGIITHVPENLSWAASYLWEAKELRKRVPDLLLAQYSFAFPDTNAFTELYRGIPPQVVTLGQYMDLMTSDGSHGNAFLFLNPGGWPHEVEVSAPNQFSLLDVLLNDTNPRPKFAREHEEGMDLLSIDGIASGHGWHLHSAVWNTQVIGRKIWYMFPPGGLGYSYVYSSNGLITDTITEQVPNVCAYLQKRDPPVGTIRFISNPGDTVIVPNQWWHSTCALDNWTVSFGTWLGDP